MPTGIFTSASINAKALSATVTAPSKTYDGSTTATPTVSITAGLIGTETVTFCPPLVTTDAQVDRIIDAIAASA